MMAHLFLYDNKIITFRIFLIEFQHKIAKHSSPVTNPL